MNYDSAELIKSVESAIEQHGSTTSAFAVTQRIQGVPVVARFDMFQSGVHDGEIGFRTTLGQLREILKKQDIDRNKSAEEIKAEQMELGRRLVEAVNSGDKNAIKNLFASEPRLAAIVRDAAKDD